MKGIVVFIFLLAMFAIAAFAVYFAFDGFPATISRGKLVIYRYSCVDLCPAYGYWQKQYYGVNSKEECEKIDGEPIFITYAGVVEYAYNGCLPK